PEGEGSEKQDPLLSEKRHQEQRDGGADHCPDDPKEALRQDEPALRLCDDEDREQRPFRLIKIEGKRDQKREQPRGSCLRCENPGDPARAWEWICRTSAWFGCACTGCPWWRLVREFVLARLERHLVGPVGDRGIRPDLSRGSVALLGVRDDSVIHRS